MIYRESSDHGLVGARRPVPRSQVPQVPQVPQATQAKPLGHGKKLIDCLTRGR
jgi:hypothetical protein